MSRWFRMYDSVLDDPKVQRLEPRLFKAWVNLLCLASRHDGQIPRDTADLAFTLRVTEPEVAKTIAALVAAGLLDDDETLHPHKWDERQFKSDNSTERVKRYRQRSTQQPDGATETPDETPPDTEQNQNRTEKDYAREFAEDFWPAYPKKADKGHALKAFISARKRGTPLDTIVAGAKRYADDPNRDPKFTKHAQGWLTGECWNDTPAEPPPPVKFEPQAVKDAQRHMAYAALIQKGISPGLQFTAADRSKLISAGLVTMEDCEKAGCAA